MASNLESGPVEGPRPFIITPDDHRGVVMCLAVLFIIYAFMIVGMRLAARIRTMGMDDWLAIAATGFSVIQFATVIGAVRNLLGVSYDQYRGNNGATVATILRASDVLLLISLFVAKCSVIWLSRRLFPINQKTNRRLCEGAMVLCGLWCLGSILAVTIGCTPQAAMGFDQDTCPTLVTRWTVIGVLDAILEVIIVTLSVVVVQPLRLSFTKKMQAMSCFLFRFPIIIFIALHIHYLSVFTLDARRGVSLTKPIIFRQAELLFSLFSAAVPALNQYLRKFNTTGAAAFGYTNGSYGGGAYGLRSLGTRSKTDASRLNTRNGRDNFPPGSNANYVATIDYVNSKGNRSDGSQDGHSLGRHNSDDMIIRKDVDYEVTYSDSQEPSGSVSNRLRSSKT